MLKILLFNQDGYSIRDISEEMFEKSHFWLELSMKDCENLKLTKGCTELITRINDSVTYEHFKEIINETNIKGLFKVE